MKRYLTDPEKTLHCDTYEQARTAFDRISKAAPNLDLRYRLRLRPRGFDVVVKVPQEIQS